VGTGRKGRGKEGRKGRDRDGTPLVLAYTPGLYEILDKTLIHIRSFTPYSKHIER